MKIVIADDSFLWRDRLKNLLFDIDEVLVVDEAENGATALQIILEKEPDLAIIDIRMPEMNGIELLKKIRELKLNVKIIILTNYPYPQYRKRCIEAGADYFLSKTENIEQIEIVISDLLKETITPDGIQL